MAQPGPGLPALASGRGRLLLVHRAQRRRRRSSCASADGAQLASWVTPKAGFDALVGYDAEQETLCFTGRPNPTAERALQGGEGRPAPEGDDSGEAALGLATWRGSPPRGSWCCDHQLAKAMPRTGCWTPTAAPRASCPRSPASRRSPSTRASQQVGPDDGLLDRRLPPQGLRAGQEATGGGGRLRRAGARARASAPCARTCCRSGSPNQGFLVVTARRPRHARTRTGLGAGHQGRLRRSHPRDQVAALQALAKEVPELDLGRVGIQGWSFGGYMSRAGGADASGCLQAPAWRAHR